ncbi:restriction endonuclease subunit S [Arenibacter sp. M-2]|uniref:restriction endonuclease subunit S n=1 Tax=Arenibacter sp. M-2 TaxID=3053612 RepID=UPI00257100EA|nr:restriction endonuclease subunit S [Arenibacter sp. M-2]MDL5511732.1 restriction endonuclease subunit S [Arenibacter sp. M-2]
MRIVELGSSVEVVTKGTTPTSVGKRFTESGVRFLRAQNVINGKVFINDDILFIDEETHNSELQRSQIKKGDVLVTIAGTIGRTAIVEIEEDLNCNQAVAIIRLGDSQINSNFLCHFISSPNAQSQFVKGKVTATIPNLSLEQVKKLKIPLPPLDQQKKIASILDEADTYRQKTKALIAKYNELTQSLFIDMFGDPVKNPKGWRKNTLENITSKIGSGATPRGGKEAYKEEGISLIRSLNVYDNRFKYKNLAFIDSDQAFKLKNVIVQENDVLFNITGASICRSTVVPNDVLPARVNQHVSIIRPNRAIIYSLFLSHLLISLNVKRKLLGIGSGGGAVMEAITKEQLQNFKIIIPPIDLQNQFKERVQAIEAQKSQAKASLVQAEDLFNSLIQRAFKGELV